MRLGQSRLSPERAQAIAEPVIKQCCDGGYCAGQKSFRFRVGENHSDRTGLLIRLWVLWRCILPLVNPEWESQFSSRRRIDDATLQSMSIS